MNTTINFWAVLVSAVVSMIIGSIWYGPLFGKKFMQAVGMDNWSPEKKDKMKKSMIGSYILQFIASLVMFYVLSWYVGTGLQSGVLGGIANAFGVWIGFVVPIKLGDAIWGGNKTLFWIGIGGMLVTLLSAGAIIGAW